MKLRLRFKRSMCVLLTILVFLLCTGFSESELESQNEYETLEWMFYEDLNNSETLYKTERSTRKRGQTYSFGYNSYTIYQNETVSETVDIPFVTRTMESSLLVDRDVKIVDIVQIVVPSGITLTIPKEVTLTIYGSLVVEGNLDNKGTIIIGDLDTKKVKEDDIICSIYNTGKIINSGNIKIDCGELTNEGGDLENKGDIMISNKWDGFTALSVQSITKSSGLKGQIINTGIINVQNSGGDGIIVHGNSIFINNGSIFKAQKATIKGAIKGEKPILK